MKSIQTKIIAEDLCICKADKGNTVIVMSRNEYNTKMMEVIKSNKGVKVNFSITSFNKKVRNLICELATLFYFESFIVTFRKFISSLRFAEKPPKQNPVILGGFLFPATLQGVDCCKNWKDSILHISLTCQVFVEPLVSIFHLKKKTRNSMTPSSLLIGMID